MNDSTQLPCPLCAKQQSQLIETIVIRDLDSEYRRQYGIGVFDEFPPGLGSLSLRHCDRCGLDFFSPAVPGSVSFYEALGRAQGYYTPERWEFGETIRRLPADADLIDIGCGNGTFLRGVPGSRKRGLEFSRAAARSARDQGLNVAAEGIETVPEGSADFVTLFHVIEHVDQPLKLAAEAARVLRSGGRLFISIPNNDAFVGSAIHDPMNAPPHHLLRWRAMALQYLTRVTPFNLLSLTAEPLDRSQLYHYRRARLIAAFGRLAGGRLPLYRVSATMTVIRRIANISAHALTRLAPTPPRDALGFSLLAEFRRH